jgi:hypothetical protein
MDYKPVNKYLPPRPKRDEAAATSAEAAPESADGGSLDKLFAWADRMLSR